MDSGRQQISTARLPNLEGKLSLEFDGDESRTGRNVNSVISRCVTGQTQTLFLLMAKCFMEGRHVSRLVHPYSA
jgi:hypothetical protein